MGRGRRAAWGAAEGLIIGVLFVVLSGWWDGEGVSPARFVVSVPPFVVVFALVPLVLPARWRRHPLGVRREERGGADEGAGERDGGRH